jgi:hypothetical protein
MNVSLAWAVQHAARNLEPRDQHPHDHAHPCKTINPVPSQHFCAARSNRNTRAMATNRDVRDMLGLPVGEVAPPTANKKSKKGGQTKRIRTSCTGLARIVRGNNAMDWGCS